MGDFVQGLYVTIMGMGLVFASLGLLMLIISGLQWALSEQPAAWLRRITTRPPKLSPALATGGGSLPAMQPDGAGAPSADSAPPASEGVPEDVVAAIAVALMVLKQKQTKPPQTTVVTFAPGSDAWRALGRLS